MVLVGAHAFLPPFREAARTAPAGSAPQVGRGRGGRVCRPRQWQRSRRRGRSSDPMTGPASAVVRRVPCPPRTRLGGSSPPQRRLADHVAHEPLPPPDATSVTLGSESHYLLACPSITPKLEPHYEPIKRLLKRLALPPWEQISEPEKISLLLGGSLPPHWKTSKTQREQWRNRCSNHSALLALKLSSLNPKPSLPLYLRQCDQPNPLAPRRP